ncbi:hypothetical protein D3C85_871300 [compost metagenome]
MFPGLRHHAVIGGHHQQYQIDALRPGEHVVGETFMTGHVDETGQRRARFQRGVEITEVDGHPPVTFFPASITGLPGQRLEQCSLAVVDVPSRADNHPARPSTCN